MCWWLLTLVDIVGMLDITCALFVTYHDIAVAPVDVCWQSWHGFQCLDLLGCSAGFFCGCSKPMLISVDGCWQLLTLLTCLIAHMHFFKHHVIAVALVDVCWSCWHDISYMQDISKAFFFDHECFGAFDTKQSCYYGWHCWHSTSIFQCIWR